MRRALDLAARGHRVVEEGQVGVGEHLPVVVDHSADELTLLGHVSASDAEQHRLGSVDTVLVVSGPHGYVLLGTMPDTFEPCRSRTMPALVNSGTIDSIRLKMPSTMATSTTWPAPPFTSR